GDDNNNCETCYDIPKESVCGSNGVTYISNCELSRMNCLMDIDIEIEHRGSCGEGQSRMSHFSYDDDNNCGTCYDIPMESVCGSNGITYDSKCELSRINCLMDLDTEIEYMGSC
ncbi:unnamed protein product, partial [Meganyctiphanes norvegica]